VYVDSFFVVGDIVGYTMWSLECPEYQEISEMQQSMQQAGRQAGSHPAATTNLELEQKRIPSH